MERIGALLVEERLARLASAGVDVLPLTGAPRESLPPWVLSAAERAIAEGEIRLPSRGMERLRSALVGVLSEEYERPLDPESEILVTNGAMQALHVTFRALLPRGAGVIIPSPAFFFDGLLAGAGLKPHYVPSSIDRGWAWEVARMESAIDSNTKAILLCNPENPTGYVADEEQVLRVVDLASRNDLLLIADESYGRFVYDTSRLASFGRLSKWPKTVVVRSMSKSYAMSSWRVGYVTAPRSLLDACLTVFEWDSIRVNRLSQVVAAEAVLGSQDWMQATVDRYRDNREIAMTLIPASMRIARPAGAAFLFVDLRSARGSDGSREADELTELGIPLVSGRHFMAPGYARIPFGGPPEALHSLGNRLEAWIASRTPVLGNSGTKRRER